MDISVYSFQDADGNDHGSYRTQNYLDAEEFARKYNLRVMDNVYEWTEAVPVEGADFTGNEEEED